MHCSTKPLCQVDIHLSCDTPGGFVLRDLNTTNGTFIKRNRIGQNERLLEHGDQIKLGGSEVTLVFQQDAAGAIVVEAAKTPPHGVYISRSSRRRTCPPCGGRLRTPRNRICADDGYGNR